MSEVTWLICQDKSTFTNNRIAYCFDCGKSVQFRPHAPKDALKICVQCAIKRMDSEIGEPEIFMTNESLKEIKEFIKAKEN